VTLPPELLKGHGWVPFQVWGVVERCGGNGARAGNVLMRGWRFGMTNKRMMLAVGFVAVVVGVLVSIAAAQDRFTVKSLNGIAFSEFKGYDAWQNVAVSQPGVSMTGASDGITNVILANPVMINAYKSGSPGNGKPFPDGSMITKIAWSQVQMPESPYAVTVPGTLKMVSFIMKDSKRFPDTNGWGYAQLLYDEKSRTFSAFGKDAAFGKTVCHECHTRVKNKDYIFTSYPGR
jgi:hypothetical protein